MNILVCYEVGINDGSGFAPGSAFAQVDKLTRMRLLEISASLREQFVRDHPEITSVQNIVLRSITRLDPDE